MNRKLILISVLSFLLFAIPAMGEVTCPVTDPYDSVVSDNIQVNIWTDRDPSDAYAELVQVDSGYEIVLNAVGQIDYVQVTALNGYELEKAPWNDPEAGEWVSVTNPVCEANPGPGASHISNIQDYLWRAVSAGDDDDDDDNYIEPEPGDNQGEIDGFGDWMIYLGQCNPASGDVMASFDIATKPEDGLPGSEDVFYFTLELENPENICELDLYLYFNNCDYEKGVWEFLDGLWEKLEGSFEWETADTVPWRVNGTDYYCRLHVFYPPLGQEWGTPVGDDDDDDDDNAVFGVGTDDYFDQVSPGDEGGGGGGCNAGGFSAGLLLLLAPLMILIRKMF